MPSCCLVIAKTQQLEERQGHIAKGRHNLRDMSGMDLGLHRRSHPARNATNPVNFGNMYS